MSRSGYKHASPHPRYISPAVAQRRARIGYRQFNHWHTTWPDLLGLRVIQTVPRSGSPRWVHEDDVPKLHVVGQLSLCGLSPQAVLLLPHQDRLRLLARLRRRVRDRSDVAVGGALLRVAAELVAS